MKNTRTNQFIFMKRKMNQELVRTTLSVLCQDRLENKGAPVEGVPVNQLIDWLDVHGSPDAKSKRVARVLKSLRRAGYIEGYEERETPSTKPHNIRVSRKGVEAHLRYLAQCKEEAGDFDLEIESMRIKERLAVNIDALLKD